MKITMWTRYSQLGASSRLRFFQFVPLLQQYGIEAECCPFFDDRYLQELYAGKKRSFFRTAGYYLRRRSQMKQDVPGTPAVIEYELLPYLPFFMERTFLRNHPYILNFDDAVDLKYEKLPFLKQKFPRLIAQAAGIITANDVLLEKYRILNDNIIKLPTVPPEIITPGREKPEKFTVIWTGTPVTYRFLYERRAALQLAAKKLPFDLLIVGGDPAMPIENVSCTYIPWSPDSEADALMRAHAGIMPLPDTRFARGKSAYKLLCYLRAGIPGIASPVGENNKVITHGINGFLADSDSQWCDALQALADMGNWQKMCLAAESEGRKFLPSRAAQTLAGFIKNCFPGN